MSSQGLQNKLTLFRIQELLQSFTNLYFQPYLSLLPWIQLMIQLNWATCFLLSPRSPDYTKAYIKVVPSNTVSSLLLIPRNSNSIQGPVQILPPSNILSSLPQIFPLPQAKVSFPSWEAPLHSILAFLKVLTFSALHFVCYVYVCIWFAL